MTKLAILALGLALAYTPVQAQQDAPLVLTLAHDCAPVDKVLPFLSKEYGEEPFALGTAYANLTDGREVQGVLMLTVNPKTKTYTVNMFFEKDDIMCLLTTGTDFQPADLKPKINL